jgi:hypothetical protein
MSLGDGQGKEVGLGTWFCYGMLPSELEERDVTALGQSLLPERVTLARLPSFLSLLSVINGIIIL